MPSAVAVSGVGVWWRCMTDCNVEFVRLSERFRPGTIRINSRADRTASWHLAVHALHKERNRRGGRAETKCVRIVPYIGCNIFCRRARQIAVNRPDSQVASQIRGARARESRTSREPRPGLRISISPGQEAEVLASNPVNPIEVEPVRYQIAVGVIVIHQYQLARRPVAVVLDWVSLCDCSGRLKPSLLS